MAEEQAPQQQAPPARHRATIRARATRPKDITAAGIRPPSGPGGVTGREVRARKAAAAPGGPAKRGKRSFVRKKKVCRFCVDKVDFIDYKKAEILAPFVQERGKILAAPHDRHLLAAPALAHGGDQARAEYRAAAVRGGTVTSRNWLPAFGQGAAAKQ